MNINDLRNRRDVWPVVAARIGEAIAEASFALHQIIDHPDLEAHLERKFRKGEAEHGGKWLQNTDDVGWLYREAADEILDFIIYQAMILVIQTAKANDES